MKLLVPCLSTFEPLWTVYKCAGHNIWIPLSGRMAGNDFCGAAGMKQTLKSSPPRLPAC